MREKPLKFKILKKCALFYFSAAHCIYEIGYQTRIFATLGRYNLSDNNESKWVRRDITNKLLHTDYRFGDYDHPNSDADIAILVMESPVEFTNFIQPICLPSSTENVFHVEGTVAGYGRSGRYKLPTDVPYQVDLKTDNLLECFLSDLDSARTVSNRTFCGDNSAATLCAGNLNLFQSCKSSFIRLLCCDLIFSLIFKFFLLAVFFIDITFSELHIGKSEKLIKLTFLKIKSKN